jgi:CBS-domain-containing membrane protein
MATDVVAISSEATVRDAMELLSRHHISGAPVVNGSTLVGVVSATDLTEFAAALSGVPTELDTREDPSRLREDQREYRMCAKPVVRCFCEPAAPACRCDAVSSRWPSSRP